MDRATAWSIVTEFTESESLRRHMLAGYLFSQRP